MPQIVLSAGPTHFELSGPQAGPVLVLLHGVSIPMWNWDYMAPALVQAGFRVLRYDTLGRGESAYPRCAYDRQLLVTQLRELLDALGFTMPVHLVGFSFGGALATLFTALHRDRVARLALIAPFARVEPPDRRRWMRLPLLGRYVMRFTLQPALQTRAQRLLQTADNPQAQAEKFAAQVGRPAFRRAFLSLLCTDALDDYGEVFAQVAASGVPTALFWGAHDIDITRDSIDYTRRKLQPLQYEEVACADHGSIIQQGHQLDRLLVSFFGHPPSE